MPRKKSQPATSPTAANRKQLSKAQIQFKKLEARLAALDKEYAAIQAATGQLVAGLLKSAAAKAKATASKTTRPPKGPGSEEGQVRT
ncbi:MAG: hypothetical protein IPH09_03145 [bacterium]|nr:hypothetical protein [bacterium]